MKYYVWMYVLVACSFTVVQSSTCRRSCGGKSKNGSCFCDAFCLSRDDCCADYRMRCKPYWRPQLGTVKYPKQQGRWPFVRPGDVVQLGRNLYVAQQQVSLTKPYNTIRRQLKRLNKGTFRRPLNFNRDRIERQGQVFYDDRNDEYYRATCVGPKETCLTEIDVRSMWMTLQRNDIGGKRLTELALPGSHDAGTSGISANSYLIYRDLVSQTIWSQFPQITIGLALTQQHELATQLQAGWRYFDLRIADAEFFNDDNFYWWHGLTGDSINQGLQQCADFATSHPGEVIILDFSNSQSFAQPGNLLNNWIPMSENRLDVVVALILEILGDVLVSARDVPTNPTINQILATGRNVLALVSNEYVLANSDLFWGDIIISDFEAAENPENLFNDRSEKLKTYARENKNDLTKVSAAITPGVRMQGGILSRYVELEDDLEWSTLAPLIRAQLGAAAAEIDPSFTIKFDHHRMHFEGLWVDLLVMARLGANVFGMRSGNSTLQSTGSSVHYSGTNSMIRYWLARPNKFKASIYNVDDTTRSSTCVQTAIQANMGDIKREVTIAYQGTPTHGNYSWINEVDFPNREIYISIADGGANAYTCDVIKVAIEISSKQHKAKRRMSFSSPFEITFQEGEYPFGTEVAVFVASQNSRWRKIYSKTIQSMIHGNEDVYLRGTDTNGTSGFAYISRNYALLHDTSPGCDTPPSDSVINMLSW